MAPSSKRTYLSPNDTYSQHIVTAVIVAHDGASWLPHVIRALLDQSRPVQRVVAVDTGSRDRSGSVLAGELGSGVVFGLERGTGFGSAVRRALQHRAANANVPGPGQVEWVWLLHDDCEPAPDALEQLLRGAAETRAAAVLGPKVRSWSDRQVILEAGVTIDTAGRRITGIEPREVDQGQHDGDRDVLAVGSAGMLVRRDVWDTVGGFDTGMKLFRDDVDFCWRVHAAGHRVRLITDAVVYHVEASNRRKRTVSVARRPGQLDRRNAMLTLAGNLPAGPMLASMADNLAVSAMRILFFLAAKRVPAALDELAAVSSVVSHPFRLLMLRRRRARGRRAAYARLRRDLPPGKSLRRIAELVAAKSRSRRDAVGEHHATDDPENADFLLNDTGLAQRILTSPAVLLFIGLLVISLIAERSLLGPGPLAGGALIPAWGGASDLWHQYLQGFHAVGAGSGTSAPPYLAIIAVLATVLGGKPWLAVDVILLGCVPLAGLSAFLAVRRATQSLPVRLWAAVAYALLPVGMGAVAAGRLGTAMVFVLIPAIAVLAGRMLTLSPRRARRAAWAAGLAVAAAAAFVPLVWVVVLVAAVALAVVRTVLWRNLAIVAVVPLVLLLPWTIQVATNPSELLLEVGLQQPGLAAHDLPARSLMLLSPGGPGLPPVWVTAGILLAALAGLLATRRRALVMVGWGIALAGLLAAVVVSRGVVTPAGGGSAVPTWPGVALLIPAVGLLLAGATAVEAAQRLLRHGGGTGAANPAPKAGTGRAAARSGASRAPSGSQRLAAVILVAAAVSAPALAAASWVVSGVRGPVARAGGPVVPPVVAASGSSDLHLRTLVLRSAGGQISYSLQRSNSPQIGDADLVPDPGAQRALATAVAELVAPNGGEAVDQGQLLSRLDIGFVLLPAPVNQGLARQISSVAGLRPVSATPAFYLWRQQAVTAEVVVVKPNGTVVTIPSGPDGVSGAAVPATGGTVELAEPAGGWAATLNGTPLEALQSPTAGWAQAFRLPAGGGVLSISHPQTLRYVILILEFLAVAAVAALALPGARWGTEDEEAQAAATSHAVRSSRRVGAPAAAAAAAGRRVRGQVAARAKLAPHGHRRGRDAVAGPMRPPGAAPEPEPDQRAAPGARREADRAQAAGGREFDAAATAAWDAEATSTGPWKSGPWNLDAQATGAVGPASGPSRRARDTDSAATARWDVDTSVRGAWDTEGVAMDARDVGAAGTGAWDLGGTGRRDPGAGRTGGRDGGAARTGGRDTGAGRTGGRDTGAGMPGGRDTGAGRTGGRDTGAGRTGGRDAGAARTGGWDVGAEPGPRRGRDSGPDPRPWRSQEADLNPRPRRGRDSGPDLDPRRGRDSGPDLESRRRDSGPDRESRRGQEAGSDPRPRGGRDSGPEPEHRSRRESLLGRRRSRVSAQRTDEGARPERSPGNWPLPGSRAPRRGDEIPEGPVGPRTGRGRQPARWTPPAHDERWPSDQEQRWPSGPEGGWPPPQGPSGWPGGGSDMLAPLPPPQPGRHGRRPQPRSDDDTPPSARWPVPDHDPGADQW